MGFEHRSYAGKTFRPTPEVHVEDDGSFGVIATAWGARGAARKVIETLTDYVQSAHQDLEATSPFQKLSCLSPLANTLRAGVMLANDLLYREENKAEYIAGVELLVFSQLNGELAFAQVGQPSLILSRARRPWIPLSVQIDLSLELSPADNMLPPLPQNLIGLHTTTNMNVSSFKLNPGDHVIFLSHSMLANPFEPSSPDPADLNTITQKIARTNPDVPFWLGLLTDSP